MTYRKDIDGLRAIAILLVVIFHFQLVAFGKSGFIGVDVFFVLSGFLITRIILGDLEAGRFSLKAFYLKRFRRLYPALLAVLLLYLLAGYFLFLPGLFAEVARETLLSLAYVVNFYFWQTVNYFGIHAAKVPLLHMWSLAIEEQFYLIYPLLALLVFRFWRKGILPLLILAACLSFALGLWGAGAKPEAAFYLLPTRAWELLLGGILAVWMARRETPLPLGVAQVLGMAGLVMILLAIVIHSPASPTPGWFTLLPTVGTMALLLAGTAQSAVTTRTLSLAPMVWIGKISYPLYLVHWPVLIAQRDILLDYSYPHRLFGLALSLVLAWGIYHLVERPIRYGMSARKAFATLGAGTVLVAVLAGIVVMTAGLEQRLPQEARDVLASAGNLEERRGCNLEGRRARACQLGQKGENPETLVFGDSHALHLSPGVDHWLGADRSGLLVFEAACMPVVQVGPERCRRAMEATLAWAEASESVETVLMVSIWRQAYEKGGLLIDGNWRSGDAAQEGFAKALGETVARLRAAGKRVILVEPMFRAPRHLPETLAKNIAFDRGWPTDRPLAHYQRLHGQLFEAFKSADAAGAERISLLDPFCGVEICQSLYEGRPIFVDSNHLAAHMAPVIAGVLAEAIAAQ